MNEEICVALYINSRNIHIAIKTSAGLCNVVDMSNGYGKTYMPSFVHYNYIDDDIMFFSDALDNELYEDTYVFSSIVDIINYSSDIFEINGNLLFKNEILEQFFDNIMKYIYDINPEYIVKKIIICCDIIDDKKILSYKDIDICYINKKNALYNQIDIINNDNIDIIHFDNDKTYKYSLKKKGKQYSEKIYVYNDISSDELIDYIENIFIKFYCESNLIKEIDFQDLMNIKKMVNENIDLIFSKYSKKESVKIYFNFSFPLLEFNLTFDTLYEYFSSFYNKIDCTNIYVYSENLPMEFIKNIVTDVNITEIEILLGLFGTNDIEIIDKDYKNSEYGFFTKGELFISIFSDDDLLNKSNISDKYFYYSKNNTNLILFKNIEDRYTEIHKIDISDLHISTDYTLIKVSVEQNFIGVEESKQIVKIIIEDLGFVNKRNNLSKIYNIIEIV